MCEWEVMKSKRGASKRGKKKGIASEQTERITAGVFVCEGDGGGL